MLSECYVSCEFDCYLNDTCHANLICFLFFLAGVYVFLSVIISKLFYLICEQIVNVNVFLTCDPVLYLNATLNAFLPIILSIVECLVLHYNMEHAMCIQMYVLFILSNSHTRVYTNAFVVDL
jgi:hypothetical protein